ncbi:MAG: stalk domain-containing protein [Syntrophomonadaceae bacterium]|nr:stalk domain-containing protein [Syntrophomonadaceae bacterium]
MHKLRFHKVEAILVILIMMVSIIGAPAFAATEPTVRIFIDGKEVASDSEPVIINNRTYVPLKVVSENLGAQVTWKAETQQIVINWRTDSTPNLPQPVPGDIQIIIDGQVLVVPPAMGKPFVNSKYRTMIPLNAVSSALDCDVKWIAASSAVDIRSRNVSPDTQLLTDLAQYQSNLKLMDGSVINSSDLAGRSVSSFSTDQLTVLKTYRDELNKYGTSVTLPTGEAINYKDLTIMGDSYLTAKQLKKWVKNERARVSDNSDSQDLQLKDVYDLAELYIKIGAEYGVRGDLAFCQAAKETKYFLFTGSVQSWQNNYCGLWATGSPCTGTEPCNGADSSLVSFQAGVSGAIFATPEAGVEAHIQHLYAYACKRALPAGKSLIDPRYSLVSRGIAPTWQGLNARWAVPGPSYGQSIIRDYWLKAF